jgi:hypothetical protein
MIVEWNSGTGVLARAFEKFHKSGTLNLPIVPRTS